MFTIHQKHDLKQWLLPKVKAAFENQKRQYNEGYRFPPTAIDDVQLDFLKDLFEFLDYCFQEPIEEREHLLQIVYRILQQKIQQNQAISIRRIA